MTANIAISEAEYSDLPAIISLTCEALDGDVLTRFLYGMNYHEAFRKHSDSLTTSLGKRFTQPTNPCFIYKAVDSATDEIVGWCLVRWEDGSWLSTPPPAATSSEQTDFITHYGREVKKAWISLLPDRQPHVVLGALHVRPDRQRCGIGKRLVEYMYATHVLKKELVIVQTRATSEDFYVKLGWTTIGSTDVDLSQWAPSGRGYGIHRSPQMRRGPAVAYEQ